MGGRRRGRPHAVGSGTGLLALAATAARAQVHSTLGAEHWCAGRGTIRGGLPCPADDAGGPCPPGCEAGTNDCEYWCVGVGADSVVVVLASIAVVVAFVGSMVVLPIFLRHGNYWDVPPKEQSADDFLSSFSNPMMTDDDDEADGDDEAPISMEKQLSFDRSSSSSIEGEARSRSEGDSSG